MQTTQEILASKTVRISAIVIGVLLVSLVSFAGGVAVGFHKAKFSYAFGENYERNFIQGGRFDRDARGGVMQGNMMFGRDFEGKGFRNSSGAAGEIISLSDTSIIIKDRDGKESTIAITGSTLMKSGRTTIKASDLKAGDSIVIIGKPSDTGAVNADFIRVFPKDAGTGRGWGMMNFRINQ